MVFGRGEKMLEVIKNELNKMEVLDSSAGGGELECVLIKDTEDNRKKINMLLCLVNNWAIVPEHYAPATYEFINVCKRECEGYLDLAYLVYNFFKNVYADCLGFDQESKQWIVLTD